MCHYNFTQILPLNHFPNLKSLCIIAQDIREIEGLEFCLFLESLWICETKINEIKNLENVKQLKRLYLYEFDYF